jgi:uncharacterized membrane protein
MAFGILDDYSSTKYARINGRRQDMTLLVIGLLLWSGIHFVPSLFVDLRGGLIKKLGLPAYKGLFALLIVASILVIVAGWKSSGTELLYTPPQWGRHVTFLFTLVTFILFVAARHQTNIKRVLRHPQLTGVMLWSAGHLFANGEIRSLILFMGIGVWALAEIALINRREGKWTPPEPVPASKDIVTVVAGIVLYGVLIFAHRYLTGVALL